MGWLERRPCSLFVIWVVTNGWVHMLFILATWKDGSSQLCMHSCSCHHYYNQPYPLHAKLRGKTAIKAGLLAFWLLSIGDAGHMADNFNTCTQNCTYPVFTTVHCPWVRPGRYLSICHVGCAVFVYGSSRLHTSHSRPSKLCKILGWFGTFAGYMVNCKIHRSNDWGIKPNPA